ncbi:MAG: cyclic nucleotide-binding domain-containing protein [Desulfobacterales bacterium]|nr:cyclic nucleotide-binding domain-containing protein [Desulfobacterales bacterium]MDD4072162.1 cyclic nucleotide-binding domain-containing protein [Desulfobacterales bacterium]MDD4394201.1 cyclic nucleotide-binding domain-containing protein [Desulfobacterales bacterium]
MISADQLKKFSIFSDLHPAQLERIAGQCRLMDMAPGEPVVRQDDSALNLYGLIRGEVQLSLTFTYRVLKADIKSKKGELDRLQIREKQVVVDVVGPGEVFGWSSMLEFGRQTATITCSQAGQAFCISADILKEMCRQEPKMGYELMSKLLRVVSDRLRNRTEKLVEIWGESFEIDDV